jgi:1-acyl-sn-glycerol-3-phosphate acyltransferase
MDRAIGIFPEGLSSPCARLRRGHPGAAHIALHTGAPILPVAITGTEKLKHINIFRRPEITVTIGQPFYLPALEGKLTSAHLSEATDFLMAHIAALLPESYRGVYG